MPFTTNTTGRIQILNDLSCDSLYHKRTKRKLSCCCDSRSYCLRRTVYWQTIKSVSVTSWRTAGTHDPIQRVKFMNAPKLYINSSVTTERDRPVSEQPANSRAARAYQNNISHTVQLHKEFVRLEFVLKKNSRSRILRFVYFGSFCG